MELNSMVPHEQEATSFDSSNYQRQPSGIRALPSHDDDAFSDTETFFENGNNDNFRDENIENNAEKEKDKTSSSSNSSSSSSSAGSDKEDEDDDDFVSGGEEFETGLSDRLVSTDPHSENLGTSMEGASADLSYADALMGSSQISAPKATVPIAKVSTDDDDNDNGVDSDYEDDDVLSGSFGDQNAPKIRRSSAEQEEEAVRVRKKLGDLLAESEDEGGNVKGVVEEPKSEVIEEKKPEFDLGSSSFVAAAEANGVKLTDEQDSVVDSIHVDVVEALRSGAALVGDVDEGKDSESEVVKNAGAVNNGSTVKSGASYEEMDESRESAVKSVGSAAVEETTYIKGEAALVGEAERDLEVEAVEDVSAANSASFDTGVVEADNAKLTDNGDYVVESTNVDVVEAVRTGATVVGEVNEGDGTEGKTSVNVAFDESASANSGAEVADTSFSKTPVSANPESPDVDGMKLTSEGDAVVDGIEVDVVEAVRSGVAVVGDLQDSKDSEAMHVGSALDRNKGLHKEPEQFYGSNLTAKENGTMTGAPDVAEVSERNNLETATKALTDVPDISGLAEKEGKHVNAEEVDSGSKQNEQPAMRADAGKPDGAGDSIVRDSHSYAPVEHVAHKQADDVAVRGMPEEEYNVEDSGTDGETDVMMFGSSAAARQFMEELEQASAAASHTVSGSADEHTEMVDGQIVSDSDEEADSDEEGDGKERFDSAALAALLKAASGAGSDAGGVTITSPDGTRLFSVERPAGLGPSLRAARPMSRQNNSGLFTPSNAAAEENLSEEEKKKLEKIQQLRVKFLRLVQRLGHSAEDSIAGQVLYRLALASGRSSVAAYSLDTAKQTAMRLENEGKDDLNFSLNILVLGKTGVGKSATVNSIFGEEKVKIDAFEPATSSINEISGVVDGVNIKVFDTPGLKSSGIEQGLNRKILASVKKFIKKCPPDIVLYVDRLDSQSRDLNDLPLLRSITSVLGSSIWRNVIVTLTHAACAPPDGPTGSPLSYEVFIAQRSHILQQSIGQAVGDLRLMNPSLMNPVSLVENHPACRKNREGQKVLPNGQTWKPQLLMLCYSMKILSESSSLSKPQDPFDHRKLFGFRARSPPLPYLLSSLLQPRAHPKLADQGGDNGDSDIDLEDMSDVEAEEEDDEYDQLPPFKPLRKAQIAKLSKEQRKAYIEEYDYRVKLLQKKQWREELRRMREMKRKGKSDSDEYDQMSDEFDPENAAPAAIPVPLPDMALPPSFDCDNPAYRYRFLEPTSQFLARPVLDTHGWDHDCGYDGVNVEQNLAIAGRFPTAVMVQVTKDKKEFNIHLDSSVSAKFGDHGSSLAGFDIQTIGKQLAYIVRGETKFKNLKKNKTAAGASVTFLGENVATGVKLEDQLAVGKRVVLVASTGSVRSQKDAAYGANLEVRLKDADYPIGQDQSSFVLSLMKWRGDLAVGGNLQTQVSVGRNSKMAVRVALNNKLSGQITVRTSSSDHLSLALTGLIPIFVSIYRSFRPEII